METSLLYIIYLGNVLIIIIIMSLLKHSLPYEILLNVT